MKQLFLYSILMFFLPNTYSYAATPLEDKIAAGVMRWWSSVRGKGLHPEDAPLGTLLTKKAIRPGEDEVKSNSRSRSAMLRVFERNSNLIWKERELVPEHI